MGISEEFVDYVVEQLAGWGEVSVRRMFGGAGLYREGTMFAVVADDVAYLKVDNTNRDDFVRAGSAPFEPYPERSRPRSAPISKSRLMSWRSRRNSPRGPSDPGSSPDRRNRI